MQFRCHHPQRIAAAKAGFSERTARRIETDGRPPPRQNAGLPLRRQTPDPFAGLWDAEIRPMLEARPGLRPITVLEEMERRHPDHDWDRLRRSLERRVRTWRAEHGADREVIFRQDHVPGQQGLSDFTDMGDLGVSIAGQLLEHRLYHFTLREHVCLCMLAYYLEWHMRQRLAPMLFDDTDKPAAEALRPSVVAQAQRSPAAVTKQTTGLTQDGLPVHSFRSLLADLATVVRNTSVTAITQNYPLTVVTRPTPIQHKAFDLLGVVYSQ